MNKNTTIVLVSALAAIVILGGGYFLFANNNQQANTAATVDTTQNPTTPTTSTTPTTPVTPTPTPTLSIPTVETRSNYSATISSAFVDGQVTPNGILTTYWFEYGATTSLGNKTVGQNIGSGFSPISSPQYISGLQSNSIYYYRLSASNSLGTMNGVIYKLQTNSNPAPKAAAPSAHTTNASSITRVSANLNGQVSPNGFQTNYWFEYGKTNNLGNITSITSTVSINSASNIVAALSGLDPLTKYYFRLNAQNQFGTVNGTTLNFTTQGPLNAGLPVVTTSGATSVTNSSARVNGKINPSSADSTYWFEYSTDSVLGSLIGNGTPVQNIKAGTTTTNVQGNLSSLNKNTKYYYRLVGNNQYGKVYGSISSFTTKS